MFCPFTQKDCSSECALYAAGIKKCSFVALTILAEDIHDMCVYGYDKFVREVPPEETNQ